MTDCSECEEEISNIDYGYYGIDISKCGNCLEEEQHRKLKDYLNEP